MRIVIADGHPTMRLGLRGLLQTTEVVVVAETGDGEEAVRLVLEENPDLVVLGLNLSGRMDGIEACRRIKGLRRPPRVLVYAAYDFAAPVSSCLLAGVDLFLSKRMGCDELLEVIRRMAAGHPARSPLNLVSEGTVPARYDPGADVLTAKEREVLILLLRRLSNAEIAERLFLSVPTVKTHLRSIFRKLGAKSRRDLMHPDTSAVSNF